MNLTAAIALGLLVGHQQVPCGPRSEILKVITEKYKEAVVVRGLLALAPAEALEVWINQETGSLTITKTNTSGTTCVLATGTAGVLYQPPVGEGT